jgi:hypothetical protein
VGTDGDTASEGDSLLSNESPGVLAEVDNRSPAMTLYSW